MTGEGNSRAELPLLAVGAVLAAGIGVVSTDHWRAGLYVIAVAMLVAAFARLTLPARRAGPLVVRSRWLDTALLAGTGVAILVLALIVPT